MKRMPVGQEVMMVQKMVQKMARILGSQAVGEVEEEEEVVLVTVLGGA